MLKHACFYFTLLISFILIQSCSYENDAIELVKKSLKNPGTEDMQTVEQWAQTVSEESAKKNKEYKWVAEFNNEYGIYLVSFVNTISEYGTFWEVDISKKTVRQVTGNWILGKKYGLTHLRDDMQFIIENVQKERVYINKTSYNNGIQYNIQCEIKNNTDKRITSANTSCVLVVQYSDSMVIEENGFDINFYTGISPNKPWNPGDNRKINISTSAYDAIYKDYKPIDAFSYIYVTASDPIGYEYDGAISYRDLNAIFSELK